MSGSGRGTKLHYKNRNTPTKEVEPPPRAAIPMKPRKGLFITLMAVFFAWVGVMLAMYFTTVRPQRHSAPRQPSPPATMTASATMENVPAQPPTAK